MVRPTGVPPRYELDIWDNSLVVHIHESVLDKLIIDVSERSQEVVKIRGKIPTSVLPAFHNSPETWGFGKALIKKRGMWPHMHSWHCVMPKRGRDFHQKRLLQLNASLALLFELLREETPKDKKEKSPDAHNQLIKFDYWHAGIDRQGRPAQVLLSHHLCEWLEAEAGDRAHTQLTRVEWEMMNVLKAASRFRRWFGRYTVKAEVRYPFFLLLEVDAGSTCILKTEPFYQGDTAEYIPARAKNITKPIQQLLLLTGLATINKLARLHGL